MTPQHAKQMSGTEAFEYVRRALQVEEHESLGDAAHRAIDAYLTCTGVADLLTIERAIVAYALRLDEVPHERLLKWMHLFQAAECARNLLERIERLTCECGHVHMGSCADCECLAFVRFRPTTPSVEG